MSMMKNFTVKLQGESDVNVSATIQQTTNDYNGNPCYLVQVWAGGNYNQYSHIWYPRIKGYRERKDNFYKVSGYDGLEVILDNFMKEFQEAILEKHL